MTKVKTTVEKFTVLGNTVILRSTGNNHVASMILRDATVVRGKGGLRAEALNSLIKEIGTIIRKEYFNSIK